MLSACVFCIICIEWQGLDHTSEKIVKSLPAKRSHSGEGWEAGDPQVKKQLRKQTRGVTERMSKVASFRFTGYETDFLLITALPKNLLSGELASCSKWEERPRLPFSQEDTPLDKAVC